MKENEKWEKVVELFCGYGENYVSSSIVEAGCLEEYAEMSFPAFVQAMANANMPPFTPTEHIRRDRGGALLDLPEVSEREDVLYDVALEGAWGALGAALAREAR